MARRLVRGVRRPPRPARPGRVLGWLLLLLPLGFWLGRTTAPRPEPTPVACPPEPPAGATTSTKGLCPCPAPKTPAKKRIRVLPIPRKATPPEITRPFERDPTAATAKYLRTHAADLSACAPHTGARVRVHLEVEVAPGGAILKVHILNLEPLPGDLASCVNRTVRALSPPGFDGSTSEVFALTVVL